LSVPEGKTAETECALNVHRWHKFHPPQAQGQYGYERSRPDRAIDVAAAVRDRPDERLFDAAYQLACAGPVIAVVFIGQRMSVQRK
jgi:hypothetical protein